MTDPAQQFDFDLHLQRQLTDRQRKKDANSNVERIWSRKQIQNAFQETFELIGGVPRLAIWANEPNNYGKFLELLMKLAPKDTGRDLAGQILEYRSNVPHSPLNDRFLERRAAVEDAEDVIDAD